MFESECLRHHLIGNAEGITAAFLTYALFKFIIPLDELDSGRLTLAKRIYRAVIYSLFYAFIIDLCLIQKSQNFEGGWSIEDFWLFLYTAVSFGLFFVMPVLKKALENERK